MGSTHGRLILFLVVALALPDFILSRKMFVIHLPAKPNMIFLEDQPFLKTGFPGFIFVCPFSVFIFMGV